MRIDQEDHLAAVIGGVTVLHHKGIGSLNVEVMRQIVTVHQAVVPCNEAFLRGLDKGKTVFIAHNLFKSRTNNGVFLGDIAF